MKSSIKSRVVSVRDKAMFAMNRQTMHEVTDVTVIAVSKTKPKESVYDAYVAGQRHFGENYVAELYDKAMDPETKAACPDIKWHFIGHLQSNKVTRLMSIPSLFMIHTIDSIKLANLVDSGWGAKKRTRPLKVMVQINVSEEPNKSGISPKESHGLVGHILGGCPNLEFHGLMTIGTANHDENSGPNPDFKKLYDIKLQMCRDLDFPRDRIKLSMGMSHDYEHAIEMGSNYVRVGTAIFGPRENKPEQSQENPQASPSV